VESLEMDMKVYYGSPKGEWVYIDGKKMTTEQATNELLIKGKVQVSKPDRDKNKPVGLFSSMGDFSIVDRNEPPLPGEIPLLYGEMGYVAPIDYDSIMPENLKRLLESRINVLKEHIKNVTIEIECFKDSPPD
jgi:hypothetical protein